MAEAQFLEEYVGQGKELDGAVVPIPLPSNSLLVVAL